MRKYKKTLMIDLDGVLSNYTKYEEDKIPTIKAGAKKFLETLYNTNEYELVLFTTRPKMLAMEWLEQEDISKYFKEVTNIKKPAFLHIDDRCICFNGDYNTTLDEIKNFNVYWKK